MEGETMEPILFIPKPPRRRRKGRDATRPMAPAALTLTAASFDNDTVTITLTFDRAIDIAELVGGDIIVNDADITGNLYEATGAATMLSPTTVQIELNGVGESTGTGVRLSAGAANGIVAVDDGAAWGGVTDLELPFS
jgi:hypothetical protein